MHAKQAGAGLLRSLQVKLERKARKMRLADGTFLGPGTRFVTPTPVGEGTQAAAVH